METDLHFTKITRKSKFKQVQKNIDATVDKYAKNEVEIKNIEKQMNDTKAESLKKLQNIEAEASKITDPKVHKKLVDDLQKTTNEYNKKAIEYQKLTAEKMRTMSHADLMRIET